MRAIVKAYAKVNIGLKVLERRPDCYHNIDSYFHLIDLHDEMEIDIERSGSTSVFIKGNDGYLDSKMDIMEKSAIAFSEKTGLNFSLSISIAKHIPSRAGLGGGSSDGAAILKALNSYFGNPLSHSGLMDLSLSVGSDLPFFTSGLSAARVRGRGELIDPVPPLKGKVDLFIPDYDQSTAQAYNKLDTYVRSLSELPSSLTGITYKNFPNDFELVMRRNHYIERISENYDYFSLSGSGSCYFGIGRKKENFLPLCDKIQSVCTNLI